ncbi:hypothetical protein [Sanguibacter sp. Leaf3]|uniref:hypothetical protein n=1 Tax=Sanguibacter sp. Leaf3 TaxID=1736209 RepID=UPI0006FA34E6|nr:hypothetical protein [Sanguibacter sp. Leaf3]KQT99670.1 hypothetical protein ASG53_02140 [Sanguibacter sp. Leaf3]
MNRTLRDDLGSLASLGASRVDRDAATEQVLATVRQRRRRRPVLVAGATAACLAVTATGALAALQLFRDDDAPVVALPDDPRGQSIRTLCGQPAPDYLEATASPSIMYSFTANRPAAVGDLDGEDITSGPLDDRPFSTTEPLPTLYVNVRADEVERTVVGPTGFVLVKDGVVVATPPASPTTWSRMQTSLDADSVAVLSSWGVEACGQVSQPGAYEPGTYTVYGITRVEDPDAPSPATWPEIGDPGLVVGPALSMTLAETDDGGVVRYFGDAAGTMSVGDLAGAGSTEGSVESLGSGLDESSASLDWPADVTPAVQAGTATAQSVVWFAPIAGFGARSQTDRMDAAVVQEAAWTTLEHIGYAPGEHVLPLTCQPEAAGTLAGVSPTDDLQLTLGYAVAFETPEDAARFVDLFTEAFGYTPVQVDGEAACR